MPNIVGKWCVLFIYFSLLIFLSSPFPLPFPPPPQARYHLWPFGKYVCLEAGSERLTDVESETNLLQRRPYSEVNGDGVWEEEEGAVGGGGIVGKIGWGLYVGLMCLLVLPLHVLVGGCCWLLVTFIPTAKLNYEAIKWNFRFFFFFFFLSLLLLLLLFYFFFYCCFCFPTSPPPPLLRPLEIEIVNGYPGAGRDVLICTYRAANLYYYKYTVGGMNIILVNLLPFVFLSLFLGYCLEPLTGATIPNLVKVRKREKERARRRKRRLLLFLSISISPLTDASFFVFHYSSYILYWNSHFFHFCSNRFFCFWFFFLSFFLFLPLFLLLPLLSLFFFFFFLFHHQVLCSMPLLGVFVS